MIILTLINKKRKIAVFLYRHFLQARYMVGLFLRLPGLFLKEIILSKDKKSQEIFWQRYGFLPGNLPVSRDGHKSIWVDALSGEICQIPTFIKLLKKEFPENKIYFSTYDPIALELAKKIEGIDFAFITPYELPQSVNRIIDRINPQILIVIDQVRFPVILSVAKARGVKAVLVSASLMENYHKTIHMLRATTFEFYKYFDRIGVAEERDRLNYLKIGANPERIVLTGNMKFDLDFLRLPKEKQSDLKKELDLEESDFIVVAGSIQPGEESILAKVYIRAKAIIPNLKMVIVPRYIKHIETMENVIKQFRLTTIRRTEIKNQNLITRDIILVDTFGELGRLYSIASVVFVGNSVVPKDEFAFGQNIIEPLVHLCPIFFGPYMNKWRYLTEELKSVWEGLEVSDENDLADGLIRLYKDQELVAKIVSKSKEIVGKNKGNVLNNINLVKMAAETR